MGQEESSRSEFTVIFKELGFKNHSSGSTGQASDPDLPPFEAMPRGNRGWP